MPLTPIPEHLKHSAEVAIMDKEILDRLCAAATELAIPQVKEVLENKTEESAAQLWLSDASSLLKNVVTDAAMSESELEELKQNLAESIKSGGVRPGDEEIREYAQNVADLLMRSWIQVLLDAKEGGVTLTSPNLLPTDAEDRSPEWSEFWVNLERFALSRSKLHELLCRTCEQLLNDPAITYGSIVKLPGKLEFQASDLRDALLLSKPFQIAEWLRQQLDLLKKKHKQGALVPAPAAEGMAVLGSPLNPTEAVVFLGSTAYQCAPMKDSDDLERALVHAMLAAYAKDLACDLRAITKGSDATVVYSISPLNIRLEPNQNTFAIDIFR